MHFAQKAAHTRGAADSAPSGAPLPGLHIEPGVVAVLSSCPPHAKPAARHSKVQLGLT